ncbi:hypothetical protein [Lyngbya sp. CCY1209]|uniref:hypothetical protein n=1 Tax=Lyngbya sp. CCY1209 TaxID=2886103 RepID=UPI002D2071B8|nr:hypothetical protein [Lyngbya sp. CCY1209]MEB3884022.1 ASCH domain-containing protein [Lyngbya sp. CCY1209]
MVEINVITLKQPWASAIFCGKSVENRRWQTSYRGELFVHAGRSIDRDGFAFIRRVGAERRMPMQLPLGQILGSVRVVDCRFEGFMDDPWAMAGHYHWKLESPRLLRQPIFCRGHLKIWTLDVPETELMFDPT